MHHSQHRYALVQQRDRDRRTTASLQEFARAVLRIDEPAVAGERAGCKSGLLAEKVARNELLQVFAQALLDLDVDRRLAARSARTARLAELRVQPRAFALCEGNDC
jgi:hypothetical protein